MLRPAKVLACGGGALGIVLGGALPVPGGEPIVVKTTPLRTLYLAPGSWGRGIGRQVHDAGLAHLVGLIRSLSVAPHGVS